MKNETLKIANDLNQEIRIVETDIQKMTDYEHDGFTATLAKRYGCENNLLSFRAHVVSAMGKKRNQPQKQLADL